jgi:hypothetical protein
MPVVKSLAVQSKCNSLGYLFSGPKTAVSQTRFAEQLCSLRALSRWVR